MSRVLCAHCNVIHTSRQCPIEALADASETVSIAVATSEFSRWASRYLESLSTLAHAGVALGKDRP